MSTGSAFDHAVISLRSRPSFGVGCHVVLTDGLPAAPPSTIPSLIDPRHPGQLRPSLASFAVAALSGTVRERDVECEAEAQISRLLEAGLRPTHLDTHKHTHIFPAVLRPLLRVAERLGVPAIRNPFEPSWALALNAGSPLRRLQIQTLSRFRATFLATLHQHGGRIRSTGGALGVSTTGHLDHRTLIQILASLPVGTWELVCHPGYDDPDLASTTTRLRTERDTERAALLTLVPPAVAQHPQLHLTSFAALAPQP